MTKRRPAVGLEDFEKLICDGFYKVLAIDTLFFAAEASND